MPILQIFNRIPSSIRILLGSLMQRVGIRKLDLLILRSYIGPFVVTFFISMFLFLMQFLWKWIEELVGKGIPLGMLAKLLLFSLPDLVPMALPLTIMVAGLMTFGNLSESFELVAMKANGISLGRALRPIFFLMCLLSIANFFFLNYVIPKAKLEQYGMLLDFRQKKPAFSIDEGVFYQGIEGFSIRIGKKESDNQTIKDILIYEFKNDDSKRLNVVKAEKGTMILTDNDRLLNLTLYNGIRYEEMTNAPEYRKTAPFNKMFFKVQRMQIDLSSLDFQLSDREAISSDYRLQSVQQLMKFIDTYNIKVANIKLDNKKYTSRYLHVPGAVPVDSSLHSFRRPAKQFYPLLEDSLLLNYPEAQRGAIASSAINHARSIKGMVDGMMSTLQYEETDINLYKVELHKKFAFSVLLILLFLISAPLGAIIKKGGIGMPLVISVVFFVIFYAINLTGEKMAQGGVVPVIVGSWMSSMFLLPVGLVITFRANRDKGISFAFFTRIFKPVATFAKKWAGKHRNAKIAKESNPSN